MWTILALRFAFGQDALVALQRQETISFKADKDLARVLALLPNRSEFIRRALLTALVNTCPLCQGSGQITPQQKRHWDEFLAHHHLEKCGDCNAVHIVCDSDDCQGSGAAGK
jgi:hypothetical protein